MKKAVLLLCVLALLFSAYGYINAQTVAVPAPTNDHQQSLSEQINADKKMTQQMQIKVQSGNHTVIYQLNDTQAAKELYAQLPLSIKVENYGSNEKIFYTAKKLNTVNAPLANAQKGTLAYYAPWGNVVMFYEAFGRGNSLYELGQAISGTADIEKLTGVVAITVVD